MNAVSLARDLIARFEGMKLEAYKCPAGIWTIGYGSTKGVRQGDVITEAEAVALLESDMSDAISCVDHYVDVELLDGQIAALISLVFNIGCGAFRGSTLLKLLNAGQIQNAAGQFKRWDKAGGKVLPGLSRRRLAEESLFRGEV